MKNFIKLFMMLGVIFMTACASQSTPGNSASAATDENAGSEQLAENDPDELICRRQIVTGTNFPKRVCRTRAELEEASRQTQEVLDYQRNRATESGPGN